MIQINNLSERIFQNKELLNIISTVLESGQLILGPNCEKFEINFANYIGTKYCVGVANGTDAIELALRALGIGVGDKVATVANAGMYSSIAINCVGAKPFFIDVDINSQLTTLQEVRRAIDSGVKAIIVTHLFGSAVSDISSISSICKDTNTLLIEDCAQAHGAQILGKRVGSFGDASTFSFYPTKNLGGLGDGGAVLTSQENVKRNLIQLRQYGWKTKYDVQLDGGKNSRLDELQAAILLSYLPKLDACNSLRRIIAEKYNSSINNPFIKTPPKTNLNDVFHLYVVRTQYRDSLRAHLKSLQIATDIHYPIPDHRQKIYKGQYLNITLASTEQLASEIVTLPLYPEMKDFEVDSVINAINTWKV